MLFDEFDEFGNKKTKADASQNHQINLLF